MEIHLVSTLTPDDERRLAPSVLDAIGGVLDGLAVSYAVRIRMHVGSPIYRTREASHPDDASGRTATFTKAESPVN
jgi:hypothetical protein